MDAESMKRDAMKPKVVGPMKKYVTPKAIYDKKKFTGRFSAVIDFGGYLSERVAIYKELVFVREGIAVKLLQNQEFNREIRSALSETSFVYPVLEGQLMSGKTVPIRFQWGPKDLKNAVFYNLERIPVVQDGSAHIGKAIVKNGVLDIATKVLTPHEDNFAAFLYLPVEYNPDATCPETMKAMEQIFLPDQLEAWMSLMGARLTGLSMQFIAALHGEGGQGKGVVRDHTKAFFGNMFTQAPMEDVNARFRNQVFVGKKIVWNSEVPATKQAADIMNNISGGVDIPVEAKGVNGIMEVPIQAIVCMDVNLLAMLPESYSTTRRLQYFQMASKFTDVEEPTKRIYKKDIEVVDKITTKEELSGWLNLLLPYAQHYLKQKQLVRSMPHNIEIFNQKADSVDTFLARYTEIRYEERTRTDLLRRAYTYFCTAERNGAKPWYSIRQFLRDNLNIRASGKYLQNLFFNKAEFLEDYPDAWTFLSTYNKGNK